MSRLVAHRSSTVADVFVLADADCPAALSRRGGTGPAARGLALAAVRRFPFRCWLGWRAESPGASRRQRPPGGPVVPGGPTIGGSVRTAYTSPASRGSVPAVKPVPCSPDAFATAVTAARRALTEGALIVAATWARVSPVVAGPGPPNGPCASGKPFGVRAVTDRVPACTVSPPFGIAWPVPVTPTMAWTTAELSGGWVWEPRGPHRAAGRLPGMVVHPQPLTSSAVGRGWPTCQSAPLHAAMQSWCWDWKFWTVPSG